VALWDLVEAERAGQLVVVGDAFAVPLVAALDAEPDRWDLDCLVVVASGGATLSQATATELLEHLPWAVLVDGYGTTETGGQGRRGLIPGGAPEGRPRFVPEPGTAVLDASGTPLAPGSREIGRIARHGYLPLGYRNDPERTAATFATIGGRRWALTGDLARVEADGTITLLGRGERTINSGGEKVDAFEVEDVIRAHPSVVDAMVVGVADRRFGERVGAVVALRGGASLTLDRLVRFCRPSLARFKVPRRLAVVEQLPRLPSGKLDYRRAAELLDPTG
jgi:acyl-CoA synthetase (AMP-forming)/AMP-acid ligase II